MLCSLHIENVAVIKKLDVDFDKGFSALTGETGAGKSIIIDSINMLLGEKTQRELIRTGEEKASVSGVFTELSDDLKSKIAEMGFETEDDGSIMLGKSITTDGKSKYTFCGRTVTATPYRAITSLLVNIHGQNDSRRFLDRTTHIDLLDAFADDGEVLCTYKTVYDEYRATKKALAELEGGDKEKNRLIEIYRFELAEIDAVKPREGEEEALEAECKKLRNIEKIMKQTSFAYRILYSSDKSASATYLLDRAASALSSISDVIPESAELAERLTNCRYEIEDVAMTVSDMCGDDFGSDPTEKLNKLEARLDAIQKLKRKYGETIADILKFRAETAEKLDMTEQSDDKIAEYKEKLRVLAEDLKKKADVLHKKREEAAEMIGNRISDVLVFLDMPRVCFDTRILPCEPNGKGFDDVEFLVSTNIGEPLKPMVKIASGGELSRIMLAMKSVLADVDEVGTLIFDEIDTGVSGKTSRKIGIKLKEISKNAQVICVTHSAQIASLADTHFEIVKGEADGRAVTSLKKLTYEERVEETARLVGGIEITETQKNAAREMIKEGETLI